MHNPPSPWSIVGLGGLVAPSACWPAAKFAREIIHVNILYEYFVETPQVKK